MSNWKEKARDLIALGHEHVPEATARFVHQMDPDAGSPYPQHGIATIEQVMGLLPSVCRAKAQELMTEAREAGASEWAIRDAVVAANRTIEIERAAHERARDDDGPFMDGRSGDVF